MKKLVVWCESQQKILGMLTLLFGTLMAVIGFPLQIWKTAADQHCGLHWSLIILPLVIFAVRIPYSIGKQAWALILPDTIGFLSCTVLLAQYLYYG